MTYQDVITLAVIAGHLLERGRISEELFRHCIGRINDVTEAMCVENDIMLVENGEFEKQLRKIPRDTPLRDRSFAKMQELCYWLLEQNPAFKEHLQEA